MSSDHQHDTVSETSPLLSNPGLLEDSRRLADNADRQESSLTFQKQWSKYIVLLLGAFLVNADSAILFSMFRHVASEFKALDSASWVLNSFIIGLIVAQPIYGNLSDIFGRKPLLLFAYLNCFIGSIIAGVGGSFEGVLGGRAIAGIGNAGVTALISILIVDLVPRRDVALWRSFIYTSNQIGRASGPPLGGFISDGLNWRWAILGQVPLYLLSFTFIWWKLKLDTPSDRSGSGTSKRPSIKENIQRIDFLGGLSLGLANCSLLLFLDYIQKNLDIRNNIPALITLSAWIILVLVFIAVETKWTREPILPLHLLLRRNVITSYSVQFFQTACQMSLYTSVPLFFIVAMEDSRTRVAFRLTPITMGVIIGGLLSGITLKLTGMHRRVILLGLAISNVTFAIIFLRWRGPIHWVETLYGLPAGLGFGVSLSAAFISLTSGLENSNVAVATSGFYLSLNLGSLAGVSAASLLITENVKRILFQKLGDLPEVGKIVREVTSDLGNLRHFHGEVKETIVDAYINSLIPVWGFMLACGCLAFLSAVLMREADPEDWEAKATSGQDNGALKKIWPWRIRNAPT